MKENLPIFGVGPLYVGVCALVTVLAIYGKAMGFLSRGNFSWPGNLHLYFSGFFILVGVVLWVWAVPIKKVNWCVRENKLLVDGVYAYVRNPVYTAFLSISTGVIILLGNYYFFAIPVILWAFLTWLMVHTEERWLEGAYGQVYRDYCKRVNRVIPWFNGQKNSKNGLE